MKKINLGTEGRLLSKDTQDELQQLWNELPTEEASLEHHKEYIQKLNDTRQPLAKVVKHLNRLQVIVNTQMLKVRMREHNEKQLSIMDFGIDVSKDQAKNEGE